jgi:hypothetical protein
LTAIVKCINQLPDHQTGLQAVEQRFRLPSASVYLQHYILHFLLWRNDYVPWNYVHFSGLCGRMGLFAQGWRWLHLHRLPMEYFVTSEPIEQAGQTKAV